MCDFNQLMNPVDCFLGKKISERIKKLFVFFSICHLDEIFFFPFLPSLHVKDNVQNVFWMFYSKKEIGLHDDE